MPQFHAVLLDETRCEFGVTVNELNRDDAYHYLQEMYPESTVIQLEDEQQSRDRVQRLDEYTQKCLDDPYYEIDHGHEWGGY